MRSRPQAGSRRARRATERRRSKIQGWLLAAGGVAIFTLLLLWSLSTTGGRPGPASVGTAMDDFVLTDLDSHPVRLSDYKGQTVLINGWATWCPPCRAEMPALNAYYEAHRDQGFVLLAVNAGESQGTVSAFIDQMDFNFPVLLDPGERVLSGLGTTGLPTSFVVGRDGVVRYIHAGGLTADVLESQVTPLLSAN